MRTCLIALAAVAACARGPLQPAAIDTAHDTCANCRMVVSDLRFAAQIVAPGDEPLFFDDIGCLRTYLRTHTRAPGALVFVADHRTGSWIDADRAVYRQAGDSGTPMGSRLVAEVRP